MIAPADFLEKTSELQHRERPERAWLSHLIETELGVWRGQGGFEGLRTEKERAAQRENYKYLQGSQSSPSTKDEFLSVRKLLKARARPTRTE